MCLPPSRQNAWIERGKVPSFPTEEIFYEQFARKPSLWTAWAEETVHKTRSGLPLRHLQTVLKDFADYIHPKVVEGGFRFGIPVDLYYNNPAYSTEFYATLVSSSLAEGFIRREVGKIVAAATAKIEERGVEGLNEVLREEDDEI